MDHIRQALDRAKETGVAEKPLEPMHAPVQEPVRSVAQESQLSQEPIAGAATRRWGREVALNSPHLIAHRLISHDVADVRSRPFDMLRTQVLQSMDKESWKILGVTSPSPACGKSVIAANLALSMARQPGRQVLLVDMDLQKPQVANYLGLQGGHGLIDVLEERASLSQSIVRASIRNKHLLVLPCERPSPHSSEWMASPAMAAMIATMRRDFKEYIVILDMPPILTSDDVIAILPQIDCTVFVAAVGRSTLAEIKDCNRHLAETPVLQVIVNKAPDAPAAYCNYTY